MNPEHSSNKILFFSPSAALIRGNRVNCAHFSGSLDWLISRLDRLEASCGWWICGHFIDNPNFDLSYDSFGTPV